MPSLFANLRPYPGRLGREVRAFVEGLGFSSTEAATIPAGASNELVARWILRARIALLVLPFHLHRADDGSVLDGVGVLLCLPRGADLSRTTVFMPVRDFSWGSSFARRLEELQRERPEFTDRLLVAHESEVGMVSLSSKLRRIHERRRGSLRPSRTPASSHLSGSLFPPGPGGSERWDSLAPPSSAAPNSGWVTMKPPLSGERLILSHTPLSKVFLGELDSDEAQASARESFRRAAEIGARARAASAIAARQSSRKKGKRKV